MRTEHLYTLLGLGVLWAVVVVAVTAATALAVRRAAVRLRAGVTAWRAAGCVAAVAVVDRMHAAGCFDVIAAAGRRLAA